MTSCGLPTVSGVCLGEVLQRRAVPVHRRVVEVRPELPHGVLRVLAHEHLPAEADDRLVGGAVAVVLEAAAVQLDQPLEVVRRPEDVVGEEAVAVVGGLLGDLRAADRAVPDERRHVVERARRRGERLQRRAELALPVDDVLAPQPAQQVVVLDGQRDALADVLAEPRVDRAGVAAAHHQVDPAVGQVLQHREVLGDLHRVVGGDQRGRGGQDDLVGACGDVAEHGGRRRRHERRVVVLAGGEHVEPDLLGLQRDGHHRLDPLGLGGRPTGGRVGGDVADGEDSELHLDSHLFEDSTSPTDGRTRIFPQPSGVGYRTRRSLRRILPAADFGIASMNSTARTFLCGATRSATNAITSSAVEVGVGLAHDERLGHLLALVVEHADDGGVGDLRVGQQQRLQLGGRHLVALVLDQLLDPVDDRERTPSRRRRRCRRCAGNPSSSRVAAVASGVVRGSPP